MKPSIWMRNSRICKPLPVLLTALLVVNNLWQEAHRVEGAVNRPLQSGKVHLRGVKEHLREASNKHVPEALQSERHVKIAENNNHKKRLKGEDLR
jgi:hypothetical protein